MKKFLLLGLILGAFFKVNAQTTASKSSIDISVGPSFPVGEFGNKDLGSNGAGLAKVGGFLTIDYGYRFSKHFGAIVSVQGRIYGVDENALRGLAVPEGTGAGLSVETGIWKMANAMVGVFQVVPLSKDEKLNLEVSALAGYQSTSSPKLNVRITVPGMGSFQNEQKSETAGALAYAVGAALKYNLSANVALKLRGDYLGGKPKFSVTTYPENAPVTESVGQNIGTFNLGIGLSIGF